ncbi:MAG TPA: hypothetical protein VHE30_08780 [Polyangiaceae bacterium]|nr:hypothetical protein [Polyangiaceae bacterium]
MKRLPSHTVLGFLALLALPSTALVAGCGNKADGDGTPGGGTGGANPGTGGANPGAGGDGQAGSGTGGDQQGSGGSQGSGGDQQGSGGDQQGAGGSGPPPSFDDLVNASDPNRNDIPGGQVCERIATIQCAAEATCCSNPGRSFDACKTTMKQGCVSQLYLDAITGSGITGYDQARAKTIFENYESRAHACDTGVTAWGATLDGLRGLVTGTRSSGQTCQPSVTELADNAKIAPYLASCSDPGNSACFPTLTSWTCSPRDVAGGKCFTDNNCQDGLYCTNTKALNIAGGNCAAQKADGSSCELQTECQSLLCKGGTCQPVTADNVFCLQ